MRIVTLDGGGIRGVLTAKLIARLEAARPGFLRSTEFFAGTSIGSINAAALAKGLDPYEIVKFFYTHAKSIFACRGWLDSLTHLDEVVRADYDNTPLKKALVEVLGPDTQLGDLSTHIMIPAFDLEAEIDPGATTMFGDLVPRGETRRFSLDQLRQETVKLWKPKYMDNFGDPHSHPDHSIKLVDACMRSSAAPTYFPSYQGFIDGGVVDNNPSMSALAKAIRATGSIRDHVLLSIGTGYNLRSVKGENLDWGFRQWLSEKRLLNIIFDGQLSVPDFQSRQLLGQKYRRLDVVLDDPIDLADVTKLDDLVEIADAVDLTHTIEWIDEHWRFGVAL